MSLLVEHFNDPYHRGACEAATHAGERICDATGCLLRIELHMPQQIVEEAWFEGEGCETCEGLCSLLMEHCEEKSAPELTALQLTQLLQELGLSALNSPCADLPLTTLMAAIASPLDAIDGDLADGTSFGGPSLREEC
ncbi:MAG: iron-sulfur cluster assembly scaffold protein [Pirellulaceae bacterium]